MAHHNHDEDTSFRDMDAASWNAAYEEKSTMWSGEPNAQLVAEAADLTPATALDVGSGEGADAVWLATKGWRVTATDISAVAVDRARRHAHAAGVDVTFVEADVVATPPSPKTYDLVSVQFFHVPEPPRDRVMQSFGEAVSPGGRLLVVGHHPYDDEHPNGTTGSPERLYRPDDVTSLFDGDEWTVEVSETRDRRSLHHGEMTDLVDTVVLLRRTCGPE